MCHFIVNFKQPLHSSFCVGFLFGFLYLIYKQIPLFPHLFYSTLQSLLLMVVYIKRYYCSLTVFIRRTL